MIDSIFDNSRKEQISCVAHYIQSNGSVCGRLLSLNESPITTGIKIFKMFNEICTSLNFDWQIILVSQSYDGAQNMKGEYNCL